ncbi:hypothetical protein SAMN04487941_0309 [Pontibacter akesuensis]|uniref:Uncharacterized protein n=1 Tax=Pontibacter akesuensis TaxID=388950 RepID=A0A1I7FLV3_9BACT|nr:hypothetical protein SAMN04487941_0309 [Pontibacter akesuensis]
MIDSSLVIIYWYVCVQSYKSQAILGSGCCFLHALRRPAYKSPNCGLISSSSTTLFSDSV